MTLCSSCENPIPEVSPGYGSNYQLDNALWLGFFGGFGMFVDHDVFDTSKKILEGPDHEAVLCDSCAHKLCDENPWLAKLLNPHTSHSH